MVKFARRPFAIAPALPARSRRRQSTLNPAFERARRLSSAATASCPGKAPAAEAEKVTVSVFVAPGARGPAMELAW